MPPVDSSIPTLEETDSVIFELIGKEHSRQRQHIELIASENFTSRAVMEAQGSCLTNKYAEGYPGKRWYGGCEFVDEVETLAIDRAKELLAPTTRMFSRIPVRRPTWRSTFLFSIPATGS